MATNQQKFDQLCADAAAIRKDLPAIVEQGAMNVGNHPVRDAFGRMRSQFDLVREVGGIATEIPWYGFDGHRPTEGRTTTTAAITDGYNDALTSGLHRDVAELRAIMEALAISTGAVINYDQIADKVADEIDQRDRARLGVDLLVLEQAPEPQKEG